MEINKEQLSKAILEGDLKSVQEFIKAGGTFNDYRVVDAKGFGRSSLRLAAMAEAYYQGNSEVTRYIYENSTSEEQAETFFSIASEDKYIKEAEALINCGIPVDIRDEDGTALHLATGNSNVKMVHLLLKNGADPNIKGKYGTAMETGGGNSVIKGMLEATLEGEIKSPYDFVDRDKVKKQLQKWYVALQKFITKHPNDTFYALALDGNRLIANSEESFQNTLDNYQEMSPQHYYKPEKIAELKNGVGDFSFHYIEDELEEEDLTDTSQVPLDYSFLEPILNENRMEKDLLVDGLIQNKEILLEGMKRTDDFWIASPEHVY